MLAEAAVAGVAAAGVAISWSVEVMSLLEGKRSSSLRFTTVAQYGVDASTWSRWLHFDRRPAYSGGLGRLDNPGLPGCEASGINFPDALSAVPVAVANHGAILLTDGSAPAADALAAGPVAGAAGEPVLLVPPTGALPEPVTSYLTTHAAGITAVRAFGGATAVSAGVLAEVKQAIG